MSATVDFGPLSNQRSAAEAFYALMRREDIKVGNVTFRLLPVLDARGERETAIDSLAEQLYWFDESHHGHKPAKAWENVGKVWQDGWRRRAKEILDRTGLSLATPPRERGTVTISDEMVERACRAVIKEFTRDFREQSEHEEDCDTANCRCDKDIQGIVRVHNASRRNFLAQLPRVLRAALSPSEAPDDAK